MNKYSRFDTKKNVYGKPLNVMLGNFCYFNKNTLHARFVPLGIGMIAQHAKQKFGDGIDVSSSMEPFLSICERFGKNVGRFQSRVTISQINVVLFHCFMQMTML